MHCSHAAVWFMPAVVHAPRLAVMSSHDHVARRSSMTHVSTHSADLLHLTTRSNFRVRLLLGCHGLESDAAGFRVRRDGSPTGNPMCKLCNSEKEDPVHFLAVCNALQAQRRVLLSHAPLKN